MKKIYLFCSAGMSTSLLAQKMQNIADVHRLPIEVKAFSHSKIDEIVEECNPECILLGPQVRYLYNETLKKYKKENNEIAVISPEDYGLMDGERVLKSAISMIRKNKK